MPALSVNNLSTRQERLAALAVAALALAAMAWTLWRYVPAWVAGAPGTVEATGAARPAGRPGDGRSLADYHLFGQAPGPAQQASAAPVTQLDLTLRGTLAATSGDDAIAIIADSDGTERRYRVGEELPGGATLASVSAGSVTLRYQGRTESLPLRKSDDGPAGAPPERRRGMAAASTAQSPGDLRRARRELLADPTALARQVSVMPVQENGEMVGVRLASSGSSALLTGLGLRSSDVITSVNGIPLNDLSRGDAIAEQLRSADHLKVNVIRNGKKVQLDIPLDE